MKIHMILLSVAVLCSGVFASAPDTMSYGAFKTVYVYKGNPNPKHVALFVSGDGGWNLGVIDMANELAKNDSWIIGIDIRSYFKNMVNAHGSCAYAAADFEGLSHFAQKKLGLKQYIVPSLIGYSSGATLVYGVLAQSPQGTFTGAISLGFCPDLDVAKPLCKGDGLVSEARGGKLVGTNLLPATNLKSPWIALQGMRDETCLPQPTIDFVNKVPMGEVITLPKVGHGFSVPANWMPEFIKAFEKVSPLAPVAPRGPGASLKLPSLPLEEVPAQGVPSKTFAILLTGDGGWAGIDRDLAQSFAAKGISVIGWNSLKYLWERKEEAVAGQDLANVISYYLTEWKKDNVILLGYSLGADILPAMAARLPKDILAKVQSIGLMGIETTYDLEFNITDWVPGKEDGKLVLPELQKLKGKKIMCLYGKEEKGSLCPQLDKSLASVIAFEGGHHFGGDYNALADALLR